MLPVTPLSVMNSSLMMAEKRVNVRGLTYEDPPGCIRRKWITLLNQILMTWRVNII